MFLNSYYTERRQASAQSDGSAIASIMAVAVIFAGSSGILSGLSWLASQPVSVGERLMQVWNKQNWLGQRYLSMPHSVTYGMDISSYWLEGPQLVKSI